MLSDRPKSRTVMCQSPGLNQDTLAVEPEFYTAISLDLSTAFFVDSIFKV